jgi:hypothetical protein
VGLGCGVTQIVARAARRLAVRQAEFESRLGAPEEALYRAESKRGQQEWYSTSSKYIYINILCLLNECKNKQIKRVAAGHQTFNFKPYPSCWTVPGLICGRLTG